MPKEGSPAAAPDPDRAGTSPQPQGDIRRGGWVLVLIGVVLVLLALALLLLL